MDRRTVNGWCFYDFGNSAFAVIFPAIYATYYQKYVAKGPAGEHWLGWGYVVSASMLLVALSSPFMGGIADHAGVRKRTLAVYTAVGIAAVLGFSAVGPGGVFLGFALGVVANLAFEGGIVFYNAYLPEIAPASHQGRVSARGFAFGYVGSFVAIGAAALLLSEPVQQRVPLGIAAVWIACALQWTLAGAFALSRLPADRGSGMRLREAAALGFRRTFDTLRDVLRRRNLRRFLLAYFIYEDGVNTVITFSGVYASQQFGFGTGELLALYAGVNVTGVIGSMLIGKPTDVKGPRWAVGLLLLFWTFIVLGAFLAPSIEVAIRSLFGLPPVDAPGRIVFWVVAMLAGLGIGGIQSSSRAFMSRLVPEGREAELFGFYALCGKTGAIMGPALLDTLRRAWDLRHAVLVVLPFYAVGYLLLRRVRPEADRP